MKENKLWKKLKDHLRLDMLSRIENKVGTGWPDIYSFHNKKARWIELKVENKFPKRIAFEPAQPNWLVDYWGIGGECYVFLFVEIENCLYIWQGKDARELNLDARKVKPFMKLIADDEGFEYLYIKLFL